MDEDVVEVERIEKLLLREEVATLLRKPISWLRYMEKRQRIPFVRLGQQIRYRESDLMKWLEERVVLSKG